MSTVATPGVPIRETSSRFHFLSPVRHCIRFLRRRRDRNNLQELLETRLQVGTPTEIEQVPAFELKIAPGGLKIKAFRKAIA